MTHCDDYRAELQEYTKAFQNSENIRTNQLQVTIIESAKQVKTDAGSHLAMHKTDEGVIVELQAEIQRLNASQAEAKNAHLKQIGEINAAHKEALDKMVAQMQEQALKHDADIKARENTAMNALSQVQKEAAATLAKRDSDHNSMLQQLESKLAKREKDHLDEL